MNLFLALCAEHKQRTRHDIFTQGPLDTTHITCEVCLFLSAEKRDIDKAEAEYYQNEERK